MRYAAKLHGVLGGASTISFVEVIWNPEEALSVWLLLRTRIPSWSRRLRVRHPSNKPFIYPYIHPSIHLPTHLPTHPPKTRKYLIIIKNNFWELWAQFPWSEEYVLFKKINCQEIILKLAQNKTILFVPHSNKTLKNRE